MAVGEEKFDKVFLLDLAKRSGKLSRLASEVWLVSVPYPLGTIS